VNLGLIKPRQQRGPLLLNAYLYPHGVVHRLPLPERAPRTLGELLALPRIPLPGGPRELAWGRGLGGVYQRPLPELCGPYGWRDDPDASAELIRFAWFNRNNPDDPDPLYQPDSRRFVMLGLLLHQGEPATLIFKGGREGDDWALRWTINPLAYAAIVRGQGSRVRPWSRLTRRSAEARLARLSDGARWFLDHWMACDPLVGPRWVGWR
jgi:hypothetical protein